MPKYRVGIIGCGRPWRTPGATGYGMSHKHWEGFAASEACELVALADIKPENAEAFLSDFQLPKTPIYSDYHRMLAEQKPDIVSIATWPALHAEMVIAAAGAGVKAIHCEKPMALTFGDARRMAQTCADNKVQLTFNHQRRFLEPFRKARELTRGGAIGSLARIEAQTSNLYDWGTHWFDMMFFLNDDTPAEWVIGQIELRGTRKIFAAPCEGQGLSHFRFRNGVYGLLTTGYQAGWGCEIRLSGTDGVIEIAPKGGPTLRVWGKGQSGWQEVPTSENIHADVAHKRAVADLIEALRDGREPELAASHALQATELIFATYESSRRRGRTDLPLTIDDSPLADMLRAAEV